jgi:hypothetical protein
MILFGKHIHTKQIDTKASLCEHSSFKNCFNMQDISSHVKPLALTRPIAITTLSSDFIF